MLARSLLAREAVAGLIVAGMLMILTGELYLGDVLLHGRKWLPGPVREGIFVVFLLLASGSIGFLFASGASRLFEVSTPLWQGLLENALFFGLAGACFLVVACLNTFMLRWRSTSPVQSVPPLVRWGRVSRRLLVGSGIGLVVGVLVGVWLEALSFNDGLSRELASSLLSLLIVGCTIGLLMGLISPFWAWLRWSTKSLPSEAFLRVGTILLGCGVIILGLACWLVL